MNTSPSALKDIWRFLVSFLTSALIGLLSRFGFHVNVNDSVIIGSIAGAGLGIVFRALESQFPWVGGFLGLIGAPQFPASAKAQLQTAYQTVLAEYASVQAKLDAVTNPPVPTAQSGTVAQAIPTPSATVFATPVVSSSTPA